MRSLAFLAAAAVLLLAGAAQAQAVVADLPTPLGTERAAFLAAPRARATVVLLAGGEGIVRINQAGDTGNQNFLIRTRVMWASYGINAVILDSPNNQSLMGQRSGAAYLGALGAGSVSRGREAMCRSGLSERAKDRSARQTALPTSGPASLASC
ncbi:MAG TPA: hypothetical protein VGG57_02725 [Stellaceae bacterium]